MKAILKKILLALILGFVGLGLVACQPSEKPEPTIPSESSTETIPSETGPIETTPSETSPIETIPSEPTPVETIPSEPSVPKTTLDLIHEDVAAIGDLEILNFRVPRPLSGPVNNSKITWRYTGSNNVTNVGVVIPYNEGSTSEKFNATAKFTLDGEVFEKTYEVLLPTNENTVINYVKEVEFKNLTEEYDVADTTFNIYQNINGHVPYVSVSDFIELLRGVISQDVDFTYNIENGVLTASYVYQSGGDSETLEFRADSVNNLITTNDMGFFYGYVESTVTNFSRNIFYELENSLNSYIKGTGLHLDLGKYAMQVIEYEDEILIPFYVANLLFANNSYYSVYYNQESLHGVYFIPGTANEVKQIQQSSYNDTSVPTDLVIHNFNYIALFFDNFYGLKEYANVDTYYTALLAKRNFLATINASLFDDSFLSFINKDIDENHTYYGHKSYFQRLNAPNPSISSIADLGPNTAGFNSALNSIDTQIGLKFGPANSGWNANSPNRTPYWFIEDEILVVTFDNFRTADIVESVTYDSETVASILELDNSNEIPEISEGNRFVYYNSKQENYHFLQGLVKDVDLDYVLSYNQSLVNAGYQDESLISSSSFYFVKNISNQQYIIQTMFDEDFEVFYFSIAVKDLENAAFISRPSLVNLIASDSAIYLEFQIEKALREKPTVTHALLDITWNMGGNVGALYRVVGLLFNESFVISNYTPHVNERTTRVIKIIPPVSFEHLNWHVLTSGVSFSAANMFATIVKQNNLAPLIGIKTGGGAASVAPVYLPIGTIFASSSSNVSVYVTGDNTEENPYVYEINEGGIIPDVPLAPFQLFNDDVLKGIILNLD